MDSDSLLNHSGFTEDNSLAVANSQDNKHVDTTDLQTESSNVRNSSPHLHQPKASRSHPDHSVQEGPHLHHDYRQEVSRSNSYHQRTVFGLGALVPRTRSAELLERWDRSLQSLEVGEKEEDQRSDFVSSASFRFRFEEDTNFVPSAFTRDDYYHSNLHTAQQLAKFPVGPYCDHRHGVCAYGVPMGQTVEFQRELQALAVAHQFPVFDGPHLCACFRAQNAQLGAEQRERNDKDLRQSRRTKSRYADLWSTHPSTPRRSEEQENKSPSSTKTRRMTTSEVPKEFERECDQSFASLGPSLADSISDFALDASSSSVEVVEALLPTVHQGRSRSASVP